MRKIVVLSTTIIATTMTSAQINIGTLDLPHRAALLQLRTTSVSGAVDSLGLKLPVVALPDTSKLYLGDTYTYLLDVDESATGMVVYNKTDDPCKGLTPCVYVWSGEYWRPAGCPIPTCVHTPTAIPDIPGLSVSTSQVRSRRANSLDTASYVDVDIVIDIFTSEPEETVHWELTPLYGSDPVSRSFTATTDSVGNSKSILLKALSTALHDDNTPIGGAYMLAVTAENVIGSSLEADAFIYVGCGAKTVDNKWLKVMCHNLGADQTSDPFTWYSMSDNVDEDIKGYLYQWGRLTDGHQQRASLFSATGQPDLDDYESIPEVYLSFFKSYSATNYDWIADGTGSWTVLSDNAKSRWGKVVSGSVQNTMQDQKGRNDPCPTGWKIPSLTHWQALFNGTAAAGVAVGTATANDWTWTGNGYLIGDIFGTALYLPAAGSRSEDDGTVSSANEGRYWSSVWCGNSPSANIMHFDNTNMYLNQDYPTAGGLSVRCVSDE
ncbi:MAG: hypothetical protein LBR66_07080 [Candidatus Symbiothrix sp.]|jgi:uncharacterized protein (TIGR02145 family)|nr:hypothetical protein [Candidatus Symbiothrix sp.]